MKIINFDHIKQLNIDFKTYYEWIDFPLKNRNSFVLPTKVKIPLEGSDYCNIMPCAFAEQNVLGLKVINRNNNRRLANNLNLDSQILLYSYDTCDMLALLDGNYITTLRTAAVAVHTILNMDIEYQTISMIGLGNIGTIIGEMLFPLTNGKRIVIKIYKYKDHAEKFISRFSKYDNITFKIVDTYEELMKDSDLIISSPTYIEKDFCDTSVYKKGCTIIPVHMRGFMECDKTFDNIVVSDLIRAKEFKYYNDFKRLTYTDDILNGTTKLRQSSDDRVIIYNLGLAVTDIYYATQIYKHSKSIDEIDIGPTNKLYI